MSKTLLTLLLGGGLACLNLLVAFFGGPTLLTVFVGLLVCLLIAMAAWMYLSFSARIGHLWDHIHLESVENTRQTQALFQIFAAIGFQFPLKPLRGMAASPDFGLLLHTTVRQRRPSTIVEFGSGTSTVLMAYAVRDNGVGRIVSIDHEAQYGDASRLDLADHGLSTFAEVRHAPLRSVRVGNSNSTWYDTAVFSDVSRIDMLVVDGPPTSVQKQARYPALPLLRERLAPDAIVIIDDAARPDEREMVARWAAEFPEFESRYIFHEKGTVVLELRGKGAQGGR